MNIPFVDTKTKKIYGCKKGSFHWYHEKGHIIFSQSEEGGRLQLLQNYIFLIWVFSISLSIKFTFMFGITFAIMIGYMFIEIYEEHWCNQYAKRRMK